MRVNGINVILTAAHCLYDCNEIFVKMGHYDLSSTHMKEFKVESKIIHFDWNRKILANDIALLKVKELTFDNSIKPIALPPNEYFKETVYDYGKKTEIVTVGWGNTIDYYDKKSNITECVNTGKSMKKCKYLLKVKSKDINILQKTNVQLINSRSCNHSWTAFGAPTTITKGHLCATSPYSHNSGTCKGDSGGPLMQIESNLQLQGRIERFFSSRIHY